MRIDLRHARLCRGAGDIAIGARLIGGERHQIGRGGYRDASARSGGNDHLAVRRHPVLRLVGGGGCNGNAQPALRLGRERYPHELGFMRYRVDLRRLDGTLGSAGATTGGEGQQGRARREAVQGDPQHAAAPPEMAESRKASPPTGRRLEREFEKHPQPSTWNPWARSSGRQLRGFPPELYEMRRLSRARSIAPAGRSNGLQAEVRAAGRNVAIDVIAPTAR